jgi:hypothetical protein
MESFKHGYIIENLENQTILVSLIESEKDYKEFLVKVRSDMPIRGMDLVSCLRDYADKIELELKSESYKEPHTEVMG